MNPFLLILMAAVLFVLLGVAMELGARLWLRFRGWYYVWQPGLHLHLHPDRELFPELKPLARIEINRDGERGDEPPTSGTAFYRILVAGGSPVECGLIDHNPQAGPVRFNASS
jgi:hypothetical protein